MTPLRAEVERAAAGEALDRWVAEYFLGWRYSPAWAGLVPPTQTARPDEVWLRTEEPDPDFPLTKQTVYQAQHDKVTPEVLYNCDFSRVLIPPYSTDIGWAWRVFERYLDPNRTSLHPCGNASDGLWWAVYYDEHMVTWAFTAPLVICKAALLSVLES